MGSLLKDVEIQFLFGLVVYVRCLAGVSTVTHLIFIGVQLAECINRGFASGYMKCRYQFSPCLGHV